LEKIARGSLYLVLTGACTNGRDALDVAQAAIAGGINLIQMREKDTDRNGLLGLGKRLGSICKKSGVKLIINDDPFLAGELDADGVHMGQEDVKICNLEKARRILGKERIIGISTHSLAQFEEANLSDVDYIAYGPVFKTKTKDYFIGINHVEKVLAMSEKPVFFIGGINLSNIDELVSMGAENIALIRGITEAEDVTARTREFKKRMGKI